MKIPVTIAFIIFIILLTSYSCGKDSPELSKNITGEWYWIKSIAIYPYETLTPGSTGVYEILKFTSDQKWFKLINTVKVDSGHYSTGHGNYLPYQGAGNYIYDSVVFFKQSSDQIYWDYYDVYE